MLITPGLNLVAAIIGPNASPSDKMTGPNAQSFNDCTNLGAALTSTTSAHGDVSMIGTATTTGLGAGRNHCLCRAAAAACNGVGRATWSKSVIIPRA